MVDLGSDRLGSAGDVFYAALLEAHQGLTDEESTQLNARLVLILANQVGDVEILKAAIDKARKRFRP